MGLLSNAADNLMEAMLKYYVSGEYTKPFSSEEIADCVVSHAAAAGIAAMAGGFLPGVGAGIATVVMTGAVWRMYIKMAKMIGTNMQKTTLKVIASAAISNVAMNTAAYLAVSFIPGVNVFAGGIINFASVYCAGLIFLTVLTRIFDVERKDIQDISNEEWLETMKREVKSINLKAVTKEAMSLFVKMRKDGSLDRLGQDVNISAEDDDD